MVEPISIILSVVAEKVLSALADKAIKKTRSKLQGEPAQRAFKQALGAAIQRYAGGERLALVRPLLEKDGVLTDPDVARELAQIIRFEREPNAELIGDRWKAALTDPPRERNFTKEAELLLGYLENELRGTSVFRPVFDAKSLDSIATSTVASAKSLSDIETRLAALTDLTAASFGDLARAFAGAAFGIRDQIQDYARLIEEKTRGFVGRQFIFNALDTFLAEEPCGYFVICGHPGIGKTALIAQLVKTRKLVHHFNVVQQNIRTPQQFLNNVCAQLIVRYKLTHLTIPDEPMRDSTFLVQCLEAAVADPANRPLILALDALDEAERCLLPPRVNVHYLPRVLPEGVYLITSTRPVKDIPLEVANRRDLDIEQDSEGNLLDIRTYLEAYAKRGGMRSRLTEWELDAETFVTELLHKSQGNFMYLRYILPAIEASKLGRGGVGELPEGLHAYYRSHWAQMREEVGGAFEETHERVICVLAVMTEPVSLDEVAEWTKLQRREVRRITQAWEQFLLEDVVNGERLYRVYHTSFAEFLGEQVDLRDFSELVAKAIKEKIERVRKGQ